MIAMFVDAEIKRHMCSYVKNKLGKRLDDPSSCEYKTLQAMKHEPGHHNHVHIRLRCPERSHCRDATVSLENGTGC
ncbi:MAG: hypothetical protein HC902_11325 [Calothrix sp. SM1_5_4]|nr:hypothetical protein [Calothrix sp. SM1_5_4]